MNKLKKKKRSGSLKKKLSKDIIKIGECLNKPENKRNNMRNCPTVLKQTTNKKGHKSLLQCKQLDEKTPKY